MKIVITIILSLMLFGTGLGQETSAINKRDEAEKNTNRFDPTYWKQDEKKHLVFFLKYLQDSTFQVTGVEVRSGNMPYKSTTGGEAKITYKDDLNKTLGTYYTSDPLIVRSCDDSNTPSQTILVGTTIEILTPYILKIYSIKIEHVYKKTSNEYIVDPYIKKWRLVNQ